MCKKWVARLDRVAEMHGNAPKFALARPAAVLNIAPNDEVPGEPQSCVYEQSCDSSEGTPCSKTARCPYFATKIKHIKKGDRRWK